jgi:hypothetical protein
MRRRTILFGALTALLLSAPMIAAPNPAIGGTISGIELCPQSIYGEAVFAGTFEGFVNGKPTSGAFWAGITHEDLPTTSGGSSTITGGTWTIRTQKRLFSGPVQEGGTLTLNEDGTSYTVVLTMELAKGGNGTLSFAGQLDHGPFPPTIVGIISQ